ncbi:MAG TPA: glycosyltransferase family 2 protein [Pyrinomonadaceae bacterium]
MLDQITPVVTTYNEAPNLERTMKQISWANEIIVIDSFSDDATTRIASSFPQTRIVQRVFVNHADQWTFALNEAGIKTPWVLALDADFVLTAALVEELKTLDLDAGVNGYTADFIYCLNGKQLRSGIYPSVTVLYRRASAKYEQDGHAHRVRIDGEVRQLRGKVLHDDRKPMRRWLNSQTTYAELEAQKLLALDASELSFNDRLRRLQVVAPVAVLFYCLVLRGGLLDGWAGIMYALQRMLAELMLSLYLIEARLGRQ